MSGSGAPQVQETQVQKTQANISADMFRNYMVNYKPLMDKYIAQEMDPKVTSEKERQLAGQINADIMKKVDPTKMSANPVANSKELSNLASVKTGAEVTGQGAARSKQLMSEENIIAMGRGEQAQATAGVSELAGMSVSEALQTKQIEQELTGQEENIIGSVAGMAAAGALKYGTGGKQMTDTDRITNWGNKSGYAP
jgi:hypothetical protein